MVGELINYITNASPTNFQPMKTNFGIVPSLDQFFKAKADKYLSYSDRALTKLTNFIKNNKLNDQINFFNFVENYWWNKKNYQYDNLKNNFV